MLQGHLLFRLLLGIFYFLLPRVKVVLKRTVFLRLIDDGAAVQHEARQVLLVVEVGGAHEFDAAIAVQDLVEAREQWHVNHLVVDDNG